MTVLDRITSEVQRNNAILFVGAGISVGSGLPSWLELMRPLADELGKKLPPSHFLNGTVLLDIAESFERERGRNALVRYLKDSLNKPNVDPNETHYLLTALARQGLVITTNYDSLLEEAYRDSELTYHTVVSDSDLGYWDESVARIVKLRGDLNQPNSLVITQRDLDSYSLRCPLINNYVRGLFSVRTPVFLGYSFSDPDLTLLMNQLQYLLGSNIKNVYALLFDLTPEEVSICRSRGIFCHVVDSSHHGKTIALRRVLKQIANNLNIIE